MFSLYQLCLNYLAKNYYLVDENKLPNELIEDIEVRRLLNLKPSYYSQADIRFISHVSPSPENLTYWLEAIKRLAREEKVDQAISIGKLCSSSKYLIQLTNYINQNQINSRCVVEIFNYHLIAINLTNQKPKMASKEILMGKLIEFRGSVNPYYLKKYFKLAKKINQIETEN